MTSSQQNPGAGHGSGVRQGGEAASASSSPTILTVPLPPSVNGLFAQKGRRRVKSPLYKAWIDEAGWKIKAQNPRRVPGRVVIWCNVERRSLRADIDNTEKAILDILVSSRVIDDDKNVTAIAWAWTPMAEGVARLAIAPADRPLVLTFQPSPGGATGGWFYDAPDTLPEEN